jgi:hypothetical protein
VTVTVEVVETFTGTGMLFDILMAITPHLSAPAGIVIARVATTFEDVGIPKLQSAASGAGKKPVVADDPRFTY